MDLYIGHGREEFPDVPHFIYGQGFGGNLVLNYAIEEHRNVAGIIVSSPWLEPVKNRPRYLVLLGYLLSIIYPGYRVKSNIKAEDLSRDLRVVYNYRSDSAVFNTMSLRLALDTLEAGRKTSISIYKINVPLLVMQGTADRIASCKASEKFVRNAGRYTTYLEWDGGFHELHNDLDRDQVFHSVVDWIEQHI